MQNMLLVCQESIFPPYSPGSDLFQDLVGLKKKKHNYSWNEVSSSHAVKLKNKPVQEKEENQEKENENIILGQTCNPSQERRGL